MAELIVGGVKLVGVAILSILGAAALALLIAVIIDWVKKRGGRSEQNKNRMG